ncbi:MULTISPECIES: ABC transporter permease [Streptomyces]|uniref:ABC transporter permease n=1 Tax=Streptomyces evansiae TaxID=3075535 RepID=A0ABU2R014_9ACTN|nr:MULTISPECIES: ABC transporter permease [unclassified Streptomyces]MDT0410048.1 ABC transporter permease [Streptomyces sp. DSM 41979]MDT0423715.1 ABC transporter permease [Streptomyces sp. DSM 41859]MYQ56140.1 ABC transporter permease subunit [Streptomyces sp. SID4926]WEH25899.1 ABC transporter permease [Streptomyces sp. AM 3-1-1]SCE55575.1 peptide/nickel transport system permease protein [Streptomyces sp. DfronAA-171]
MTTTTAPPAAEPAAPPAPASTRAAAVRSLLRNKLAVAALAFLLLVLVCAVFAPLIAPADPNAQDLLARLKPPAWQHGGSSAHLLGTDQLGRDLLSRVIYGTRVSLMVGAGAALLAGVLGTLAGLAAGYFGGWTDRLLMRLADIQLAFPAILLALAVVGFVGSGLWYVILVLGITGWVSYARVVRSEVLSLRTRDFVTEAHAIGVRHPAIMRRHLLPNVMAPLATIGTLHIAAAIVAEASLSYLGLGVPKETVTWGAMLADGQLYLGTSWWVAVFPGIALMLTSLAVNITGDALRDVADPKAYRR